VIEELAPLVAPICRYAWRVREQLRTSNRQRALLEKRFSKNRNTFGEEMRQKVISALAV